MSQSTSLEPKIIDCETASAGTADNTTYNKFMETLPRLISRHRSLAFDPVELMVYYKSSMDIRVVNSTEETKLATWNTENGFALLPGVVMEPDKRFFRIGVIDNVSNSKNYLDVIDCKQSRIDLIFSPLMTLGHSVVVHRERSSYRGIEVDRLLRGFSL